MHFQAETDGHRQGIGNLQVFTFKMYLGFSNIIIVIQSITWVLCSIRQWGCIFVKCNYLVDYRGRVMDLGAFNWLDFFLSFLRAVIANSSSLLPPQHPTHLPSVLLLTSSDGSGVTMATLDWSGASPIGQRSP